MPTISGTNVITAVRPPVQVGVVTGSLLLEDAVSHLLQEDGVSKLLLQ